MCSNNLIERHYQLYRKKLVDFITTHVGDRELALDLSHDVFLKLLCLNEPLVVDSLKSLSFGIAVNLTRDYWRRQSRRCRLYADINRMVDLKSNCTWEDTVARDLSRHERECIDRMPEKRRMIYERRRFHDESAKDIAAIFSLSIRTVENQLRLGFQDVRKYMRACV